MKLNAIMSMLPLIAGDIDQAFVQTYETTLRILSQQKSAKLKQYCQHKNESSESHNWETLASMDPDAVKRKRSRQQSADGTYPTPVNNKPFAKRRTNVDTYDTGHVVEQEDISQMLLDPNSALITSQAYAMARKTDDLIIAGAWKPASIKGTGQPVEFLVTQEIGDGTKPISFDYVTEITERFLENEIEPEVSKVIVIGPTQARKLLQITEATSADYTSAMDLQSKGIITNWMGYTWIVSTRLDKFDPTQWGMAAEDGPQGDEIWCIAMTDMALGYHSCKDIWTKVAEDPSASFAWRIYSAFTADCVRVEDEHIFKLRLKNSL
ncbi:hypothetical protein [Vibrio phage JSF33]|nr:hypothetical protein [Vibrio phage JSF33]